MALTSPACGTGRRTEVVSHSAGAVSTTGGPTAVAELAEEQKGPAALAELVVEQTGPVALAELAVQRPNLQKTIRHPKAQTHLNRKR